MTYGRQRGYDMGEGPPAATPSRHLEPAAPLNADTAADLAPDLPPELEGDTDDAADMDTAEVLAARARVRRWLRERIALVLQPIQQGPEKTAADGHPHRRTRLLV
jgi:hypothetical protein